MWGSQGPRCVTIGWRPPIVPFLVVPRNGRATKSQPGLLRTGSTGSQILAAALPRINLHLHLHPHPAPAPTNDQTLSSSREIAFLLHLHLLSSWMQRAPHLRPLRFCASRNCALANRHGCNSIDRASFVASSRRPGSRPLEAQLLPPSAELDVAVGCEDTSSRALDLGTSLSVGVCPTHQHHYPPCRPLNVASFPKVLHRLVPTELGFTTLRFCPS